MSKWPWWVWTLIILGIVVLAPTAGRFVLNVVTRGKRLTWTDVDDNGDMPDDPDALADAAANQVNYKVETDEYALARMFASEGESEYNQATKVAIGWVAVNAARSRGLSVTQLLTNDVNAHGQGKFGEQKGRWASTRFDPYEGDLTIAQAVLQGNVPDPTNGAVHYYEPTLQDKLFALAKVKSDADAIDNAWAQETGNDGFYLDGLSSDLKFYSPNGAPGGNLNLPT